MTKLISWNVNGLRAVMGKNFYEVITELDADVFCFQETKLQEGQVSLGLPQYHAYWNYADKKGYSGTLVLTKEKPLSVRYGMGVKIDFDVKWRDISHPNRWDRSRREKVFRPRFGVRLTMPEGSEQMRYFGYGPMESYEDKRLASKLGVYASTVTENYEPYVFPQENSSHWGCRWADVHTVAGHGFLFSSDAPFSFSASIRVTVV